METLLALQPVYASNLDLRAFDLVLENPHDNRSLDEIQTIGQVIAESYTSVYQGGQLRTIPCFLKVAEAVLFDDLSALSKSHFILELDSNINMFSSVSERLRDLGSKGFRLALSGELGDPEALKPLLEIIHIVRLDASVGAADLDATARQLKPYNLELLADELESPDQFRRCVDVGFQYFLGNFLGKPNTGGGKVPASNKLLLIQVLAELERPETTIDKLERLIVQDANLTYKFIKVVNSVTYGIDREIETLSHALAILGTKQIRSWVSMFLLQGHDNKPEDLIRLMLIRARMCETIAELTDKQNAISYFIVGLLSQLDVLTEIAMSDLMASVPLKQEIKDALLFGKGDMGMILREVEDYERGRFDRLPSLPKRSFYETAYRHSTGWARQLQNTK